MAADETAAAEAERAAQAVAAPLLQLSAAVTKAMALGRSERAVELSLRLVAAADEVLPPDSLGVAWALTDAITAYNIRLSREVPAPEYVAARRRLLDEDGPLLPLSRGCLTLLHRRWRAGTLFSPSVVEEMLLFASSGAERAGLRRDADAEDVRAHIALDALSMFATAALAALRLWQPARSGAELEDRVRAAHGVLAAAAALDAQRTVPGRFMGVRDDPLLQGKFAELHALFRVALFGEPRVLRVLRTACGVSSAEKRALQKLTERIGAHGKHSAAKPLTQAWDVRRAAMSADDVARHGLRLCALPGCGAREAHPKHFKLCGRCKAVVYCSPAHQHEDWKRHKREGGCGASATEE